MANLTRTVEVKVIAEYWFTVELDEDELDKTAEELETMAWKEFYDEAHRASIESTTIENDITTCWDCDDDEAEEGHECPEEDEEEVTEQ